MGGSNLCDSLQFNVAGADLLAWYDIHARDLPWRVGPTARSAGHAPTPMPSGFPR
jgi:adenine-specific DNA glycosylase